VSKGLPAEQSSLDDIYDIPPITTGVGFSSSGYSLGKQQQQPASQTLGSALTTAPQFQQGAILQQQQQTVQQQSSLQTIVPTAPQFQQSKNVQKTALGFDVSGSAVEFDDPAPLSRERNAFDIVDLLVESEDFPSPPRFQKEKGTLFYQRKVQPIREQNYRGIFHGIFYASFP